MQTECLGVLWEFQDNLSQIVINFLWALLILIRLMGPLQTLPRRRLDQRMLIPGIQVLMWQRSFLAWTLKGMVVLWAMLLLPICMTKNWWMNEQWESLSIAATVDPSAFLFSQPSECWWHRQASAGFQILCLMPLFVSRRWWNVYILLWQGGSQQHLPEQEERILRACQN